MKSLKEIITIAGLLLLVSCGQTIVQEVDGEQKVVDTTDVYNLAVDIADCLSGDEDACDRAEANGWNERLEEIEEELTANEKRLLCLEGEYQHCGGTNPFVNIAIGDIIRLNEDYGFEVIQTIAEGSPNTVLLAQAYGNTTFAGTYGVYHKFIISLDGDITRKSVEIALPHAAYPGYERANATIDWSAELVKIDGEWAMEKTNGQIITIDF